MYYYLYKNKDGSYEIECEELNPYLMMGDYLLFDTEESCIEYWKREGILE